MTSFLGFMQGNDTAMTAPTGIVPSTPPVELPQGAEGISPADKKLKRKEASAKVKGLLGLLAQQREQPQQVQPLQHAQFNPTGAIPVPQMVGMQQQGLLGGVQ